MKNSKKKVSVQKEWTDWDLEEKINKFQEAYIYKIALGRQINNLTLKNSQKPSKKTVHEF